MSEKIDWKNAQFTAADLKKHFGLEAGGGTFGSSNAQLGKNYLSASDVDRLKSDPMIKEAYFALRGEDHARKEHWDQDGNEGFELGEGSLDALLDDITADKGEEPAGPPNPTPEEYEYSQHIQDAKERVSNFQKDRQSGALYDTADSSEESENAANAMMDASGYKFTGQKKGEGKKEFVYDKD